MDELTPAARTALDVLATLGQGNINEIREHTGKAKSTTDKALKELADAGLIEAVDTGAGDDGTPTRWRPTTPATVDPPAAEAVESAPDNLVGGEPATMAATDLPDPRMVGAEPEPTISQPPTPDGATAGATKDAAGTPPVAGDNVETAPAPPVRQADRNVLIVAGVLGDYPEGTTTDIIADACGLGTVKVVRLLAAMEQVDAARRVPADADNGVGELWKPGPGKAGDVDPNPPAPRCHTCGQVLRPHRSRPAGSTSRESAPLNSDGNEPLGRNVIRGYVREFLDEHPGHVFTPQDIASELSARHNRLISSGAVRNNCTGLAASGLIQLATESPLAFTANTTPPAEGTTE